MISSAGLSAESVPVVDKKVSPDTLVVFNVSKMTFNHPIEAYHVVTPNYIVSHNVSKMTFNHPIEAYEMGECDRMVVVDFKVYDKETKKEIPNVKFMFGEDQDKFPTPKKFVVEEGKMKLPVSGKYLVSISGDDAESGVSYESKKIEIDLTDLKDSENSKKMPDVFLSRTSSKK